MHKIIRAGAGACLPGEKVRHDGGRKLLLRYVRKFGQPYRLDQHYLNPQPVALMLRNHV
ncbi:MAG: hypothetical protein M0024_08640 [Nitrospiraceae bacterium]|nr:hypothetical protein [Nitrospiraceae bacterium]